MNIPQELYDSEINFEIASDWDNGFRVRLGHIYTGDPIVEVWVPNYDAAIEQLSKLAIAHYPESKFAKEIKKRMETAGVPTD